MPGTIKVVRTEDEPPPPPGWPHDWQKRIKANLAGQIEAGATLYGRRSDGAYIAYSKDGERVLEEPQKNNQ